LGIGVTQKNGAAVVVATYSPRGNVISVGNNKSNASDPNYFFLKNVFPLIRNPVDVFPSSFPLSNGSSSTVINNNTTAAKK